MLKKYRLPPNVEIDGYAFNLSGGISSGQVLAYDGYSIIAQSSVVATISDLRALAVPTANNSYVKVNGYYTPDDGGGGEFYWDPTSVVLDDGGAIIKPNTVSGVGRWMRNFEDPTVVNPKYWGAKDDSTLAFDGYAAFSAAITYLINLPAKSGTYPAGKLIIPRGSFRISQTLNTTNEIDIEGIGMGHNSMLYFYNAQNPNTPIDGIIVNPATGAGVQAYGSLKNFKILGYGVSNGNNGPSSPYYNHMDTLSAADTTHAYVPGSGLILLSRSNVERVNVEKFQFDGIRVNTTDTTNNANVTSIKDCVVNNNGRHGLYLQGDNANACVVTNLDANNNGGHGICDRSFLGNTYTGCQIADNGDFVRDITCLARVNGGIQFKYGVEQAIFAGSNVQGGVYVTTDAGLTWQELDLGYQDGHNASTDIAIRNLQTRALVMSTTTLFSATPYGCFSLAGPTGYASGNVWSKVSTGLTTTDGYSIDYDLTGSKLYYGTNGGGVFLSTNSGTSWTAINTGLGDLTVHALACDPGNTGTVYAGTNNGVYKTSNSGTSWTLINTGFTSTVVNCLAMITGILYAGCSDGKIYKSTDGSTWTNVFTEAGANPISSIAVNAANSSIVLAATNGAGAYVSTDSGTSWTQQNSGLTNLVLSTPCLTLSAALITANGQMFVGGTSTYSFLFAQTGGVFRSSNNGASWLQDTNQTPRHGGSVRTNHATSQTTLVGTYMESDQTPQVEPGTLVVGGILAQNVGATQLTDVNFPVSVIGQFGIQGLPNYCVPFTLPKVFKPTSTTTTLTSVNAGTDSLIHADMSLSFGQLTIPVPSATNNGSHIVIRRIDSTTNACSLVAAAGTFSSTGTNHLYLYGQNDYVHLVSDLANNQWRVLGRGQVVPQSYTSATLPNPASITIDAYAIAYVTDQSKFVYFDGTLWTDLSGAIKNIATLRTISQGISGKIYNISGYYTTGDGGGGEFYWDGASTATEDGGTIIKPTAVSGAGRWRRVYKASEIDPRWFGAFGDGTSHPLSGSFATLGSAQAIYPHATSLTNEYDWVAIQAAINAAINISTIGTLFESHGGTVKIQKGLYLCDQTINCNATSGITLLGSGHGGIGTGNTHENMATLIYTGNTATRFIDGRSTGTFTIDGIGLGYYSSSWNGRVVDISHVNPSDTQNFTLKNCTLGGMAPYIDMSIDGVGAHSLLYCSNAITSRVENCMFVSAQRGIYGRKQDGSYFNAFTIDGCTFVYLRYALVNFGDMINVNDCIFEGSGGQMRAIYFEEYLDDHILPADAFTFDIATQTITRSSGDWIVDGFLVGMTPSVFGFHSELNIGTLGAITTLTSTVMTVASGIVANEVRTSDCKVYATSVTQDHISPTSEATLGLEVLASNAAGTFTRNIGSWIDDGAFVGMSFNISSANINSGVFGPIVAVTATEIYLGPLSLTFSATNSTVTRSDSHSFVNDGWQVGMSLNVASTISNNGLARGTITSVTANVLTVNLNIPFVDETSSIANIYALFESEFSARTQASVGTTLVDGYMTAGHIYQSAGCGPVGFSGCWAGDQFLPSTWLQFGGAAAIDIRNCEFVGNLRVADIRQQASGFTVNGTHLNTIQEPFYFHSLAGSVSIKISGGGSAADIIATDDSFANLEMFNTVPTATGLTGDTFANNYRKWTVGVRDYFTFSKAGISADGSNPLLIQLVQGGSTVLELGGLTQYGSPTATVQGLGRLLIQPINSGPILIGSSFNKVGIGYGYYDSDLLAGNPTSWLHLGGAIATPYRVMTADGYIDERDSFVNIDATLGNVTMYLLYNSLANTHVGASTCKGREYTIKRLDNSSNTVSIVPLNSQTIDGAASYSLDSQNATVTIKSDGANWRIKNKSNTSSNASDVQLTDTNPHNIVTYTPNVSGNYLVYVYYRVITATTNVTITVSWTDGSGSQTTTIINTSQVVGSYSAMPTYINIVSGNAITASATAGTANQVYVSASIVQL